MENDFQLNKFNVYPQTIDFTFNFTSNKVNINNTIMNGPLFPMGSMGHLDQVPDFRSQETFTQGQKQCVLLVSNLNEHIKESTLFRYFSIFGQTSEVYIQKKSSTGFVFFVNEGSCQKAFLKSQKYKVFGKDSVLSVINAFEAH